MEEDLIEIHEDLRTCLTLLSESGKAYQAGEVEDMVAQLAATAPLLERATHSLGAIIEDKDKKKLIDVDKLDQDLKPISGLWGMTETGRGWALISDAVVIIRRAAILNEEMLEMIEKPFAGVQASLSTVERKWNTILNTHLLNAQWGGINEETVTAFFDVGSYWVEVNAERIVMIRESTLFDRVEVSFEEQAIVFWKTGDPEPVAMMLYEGEKKSSYEKIRTDNRSSRSG